MQWRWMVVFDFANLKTILNIKFNHQIMRHVITNTYTYSSKDVMLYFGLHANSHFDWMQFASIHKNSAESMKLLLSLAIRLGWFQFILNRQLTLFIKLGLQTASNFHSPFKNNIQNPHRCESIRIRTKNSSLLGSLFRIQTVDCFQCVISMKDIQVPMDNEHS